MIIMALLLLTPVDTVARTQLFSVHMAQAVILTTLCAPLVLFGCPAALLRPLVNAPVVAGIVRVFTRPLVASLTFNLLFLLWHTPRLYHFALVNDTLYHVEMLSIFLASLLNWWPLIGSVPELRRMSYPMQMLYAFFDGQPVDIFAFVLVFSGTVIYPYYAVPPQLNTLPFSDQAVGGALLLIPGIVDLVVMSPLFVRWLSQIEQQTKLGDQKRQEQAEAEEAAIYEEVEVEEEGA
jgi:putative membrane protein